ncbi:hypothetical protein D9M72_543810 [compost metagenome]
MRREERADNRLRGATIELSRFPSHELDTGELLKSPVDALGSEEVGRVSRHTGDVDQLTLPSHRIEEDVGYGLCTGDVIGGNELNPFVTDIEWREPRSDVPRVGDDRAIRLRG